MNRDPNRLCGPLARFRAWHYRAPIIRWSGKKVFSMPNLIKSHSQLAIIFSLIILFSIFSSGVSAQSSKTIDLNSPVAQKWCYYCHGYLGAGKYEGIPKLTGQKFSYIVKQLKRLHDRLSLSEAQGKNINKPTRAHRSMGFSADRLSHEEMTKAAKHFSSLECKNKKSEKYAKTAPPASVKPCFECHGEDGIGKKDNIPNLAAQNYFYLLKQLRIFIRSIEEGDSGILKDWRSHPAMNKSITGIEENDIKEMAKFFSELPC